MYNVLGERASQSPLFLPRNLRRPIVNDGNDNDNDYDDDVVLVKHTLSTPTAAQLLDNAQPQADKTQHGAMKQHQRVKRKHSRKASGVVYRCTEPSVTWETSRRPDLRCAFCHVRHDFGRGWKHDRVELLRHLERCHSELRFSFGVGMSSSSSRGHHQHQHHSNVTVIEVSFYIFLQNDFCSFVHTTTRIFG